MRDLSSTQTVTIEPRRGWRNIAWRELYLYRDLFRFLVLRDIKVLYKQTALGFGWAIIRPVFSVIVFTFVFGNLAGLSSDGVPYPLFSLAAVLPWNYFAAAVRGSSNSMVSNARMLTKVYLPRLMVPMTPVVAGLVDFAIGFLLLMGFMAYWQVPPTPMVLMLPALVLLMVMTAAGLGFWLSALSMQYRDVKHAMVFLVQLLMYASPVVWSISLLGERFPGQVDTLRWIYGLYPMAGVIEGFRSAMLGTTAFPWDLFASGCSGAAVLSISGAFYFRRAERHFADVA